MSRATIIVHGAYADPRHYEPLACLLRGEDRTVIAPDIGQKTLGQATSLVQNVVDSLPEAPIVIAHSWGGATAGGLHGVARFVFLDAFVMETNETAIGLLTEHTGKQIEDFQAALRPSSDGTRFHLDPDLAGDLMFNGCDDETRRCGVALLRSELASNFGVHPIAAAWREKPSLYIRFRDDRTFSPSLSSKMASRCETSVDLDGCHFSFFDRPADIAGLVKTLQ